MAEKIKRHELWRRQYREDRFMAPLSDSELDVRFGDITSNVANLTDSGLIGFQTDWMEPLTHVFEEFTLRGLGIPAATSINDSLRIPKATNPYLCQKVRSIFPKGYPDRFTLLKYGKGEFLEPLYRTGKLRLAPASKYADPSLNLAIKDDELNFLKILSSGRIQYKSKSDFYCFCSSWIHSNRLVSDFDVDTVLIIHDPHEFFRRLMTAFNGSPKKVLFNKVTYVDPLRLGNQHIESIAFTKHFRFIYQFEHRLVIWPSNQNEALDYEYLDMGSLTDIAQFIQ